jgi:hypothetical protein
LPPTPAGNAPETVLTQPIAPEGNPAQPLPWARPSPRNGGANWQCAGCAGRARFSANPIWPPPTPPASDAGTGARAGGQSPATGRCGLSGDALRTSNMLSTPWPIQCDALHAAHCAGDLSWSPDVFGGGRAKVRSARAAAAAQAARRIWPVRQSWPIWCNRRSNMPPLAIRSRQPAMPSPPIATFWR